MPSLLVIVGALWAFGRDNSQNTRAIHQLTTRTEALEAQNKASGESLAEIRTDLRWIRQTLENKR
jgi:hypothetical protein